ncbi:MAG TPA: DUF4998 domain-containing protein [Sphingobacterium sp.]|nr:DUF4998 domain-containing protein [Sphingobacterium sp.]
MKLLTHKFCVGSVLLALVFAVGGCSKMDNTYKQFLEDGMKVYIGKVDSIYVYPGNKRLQLGWLPPSDPKTTKARVYWNNGLDSVDVPITRTEGRKDTIKVMLNDFAEGTYVFDIYTLDNHGRKSLKTEVVARVYGDNYKSSLLSRPIDSYEMTDDDELRIMWGTAPDLAVYGSQLVYEDSNGDIKTLFIPGDEAVTYMPSFVPQTIAHRTVYLPTPLAIDTFYTDYSSLRIKGKPIELSKAGWTAETSSFDDRSGANYRPGSNAIDGNPTTIWVNKTTAPTNVYPHTITVDMKTVYDDLEGFAIITRVGDAAARPKTVELSTSEDGENWTLHVIVDLENSGDKQFIALPQPVSAQFFRVHATASYSGGNIALAEIGMYYR